MPKKEQDQNNTSQATTNTTDDKPKLQTSSPGYDVIYESFQFGIPSNSIKPKKNR